MINFMDWILFFLFLFYLWLNWRDYRAGSSKTHQWVVPRVGRKRGAVMVCCILSLWSIVGLGIFISPTDQTSRLGNGLMILTMLLLQIALLRRSECCQPRRDDEPPDDPPLQSVAERG